MAKKWEHFFRLGIRKLREEKGMTQKELAALSGVSRGSINYLENDKRGISSNNQWLLAQVFGLTPEDVMNIAKGDLPPPENPQPQKTGDICEKKQQYRSSKTSKLMQMVEQFDEAGDDEALDALFKYAESGVKKGIGASIEERVKLLEEQMGLLLTKDRDFKQVKKTG